MLTYRNGQEWRTRAACRGTDPDDWDVSYMMRIPAPDNFEQRSICESCPVLKECAADSVLAKDVGVIRAGVPITVTGPIGRRRAWKALELIALTGDIESSLQEAFDGYRPNSGWGAGNE